MKPFPLTSLAVATAAALSLSGNAQAGPYSYAISYNNIFDLVIGSAPFVPLSSFTSFSTTSGADASLNGSGVVNTDTQGGPANAAPAAGTGSTQARADNVYTPIGITAGSYSTADAQVSRTVLQQVGSGPVTLTGSPNTQAWNIAESLVVGNGETAVANGTNSSVTGFDITVNVALGAQFLFDFKADPYLYTALGLNADPGSQAFGALSVVFTITPAGSSVPVFIWAPDGLPGGILGGTEIADTYSLNLNTSVATANDFALYDPTGDASLNNISPAPFGSYRALSNALAAGQYTINLNAQERTTNRLFTHSVPEPGSMALLGLGLAGLGWVSRRRKVT